MDKKFYNRINIENLQNGFIVEATYKVLVDEKKTWDYDRFMHKTDKFVFLKWEEVVDFVKNTELEIPPKQV